MCTDDQEKTEDEITCHTQFPKGEIFPRLWRRSDHDGELEHQFRSISKRMNFMRFNWLELNPETHQAIPICDVTEANWRRTKRYSSRLSPDITFFFSELIVITYRNPNQGVWGKDWYYEDHLWGSREPVCSAYCGHPELLLVDSQFDLVCRSPKLYWVKFRVPNLRSGVMSLVTSEEDHESQLPQGYCVRNVQGSFDKIYHPDLQASSEFIRMWHVLISIHNFLVLYSWIFEYLSRAMKIIGVFRLVLDPWHQNFHIPDYPVQIEGAIPEPALRSMVSLLPPTSPCVLYI